MLNHNKRFDYVIIGGGIIGLSIARNLLLDNPYVTIAIIEKENKIGLHGSGRNSGVLHSGIYYQQGSLKAKVCLEGARMMKDYCMENQLPIHNTGKIIIPTTNADHSTLNILYQRAMDNGASVQLINESELKKIEPEAYTATGQALFSPDTSVIDSTAIMEHLFNELKKKNVNFYFNCHCSKIDIKLKRLNTPKEGISYGHLINTAGLFSDKIALACGLSNRYTMVPFKGIYYELLAESSIKINHLIYPVPDMNMPFLGVHFTKSTSGKVYIGPTAIPALGRENYHGIQGMKLNELVTSLYYLGKQYLSNKQGFRNYANQEIPRLFKSQFLASAKSMVPKLTLNDLVPNAKVGIRAQLYDKEKKELVMDFLISKSENETHILNAVSPGFTSSFSLAKLITSTQDLICMA